MRYLQQSSKTNNRERFFSLDKSMIDMSEFFAFVADISSAKEFEEITQSAKF